MVCLDSSFVIDYLRGKESANIFYHALKSSGEIFSISTPVIMEIISGAYSSQRTKEEIEKIEDFLLSLIILNFNKDDAFFAGKIESELIKKGEIIDAEDIMIGAIALSNNEILITRNKKHFEKIKGLKIESY